MNTITEKQIISKLNIKPTDKIIDVGGSANQKRLIRVHTLVDLFHPKDIAYKYGNETKLKAEKFVKIDITKDKLPFKNKEFDVVLCTHTLEDIYNPFLLIEEMQRIGKRGLITTPEMGMDFVHNPVDITRWGTGPQRTPGWVHHKWMFTLEKGVMKIVFKSYPVLYSTEFQIYRWLGKEEFQYFWKDKIKYEVLLDQDTHKIINNYRNYLKQNKGKYKRGVTNIFIDSPKNYLKALIKKIIKRGESFQHD